MTKSKPTNIILLFALIALLPGAYLLVRKTKIDGIAKQPASEKIVSFSPKEEKVETPGIAFELIDVDEQTKLGEVIYIVQAKGTFLTFYLNAKNHGEIPVEVDPKSFAIVTNTGETYSISPEGQSGRNITDKSVSFFKQEIPPANSLQGQITFDVLNPNQPMKLLYKGTVVLENITW